MHVWLSRLWRELNREGAKDAKFLNSCYAQQGASRTAEDAKTAEEILLKFSARFASALSAVKVRKVSEKFIDTPVKRYSSGMYVRLAFAVAAHLEPEILLVDESLP